MLTRNRNRLAYQREYYKKNKDKFREQRKLRKSYYTEYRKNNRVKIRLSIRKCRENKRNKVLSFLGNKCVRCGISDFRVLQIDHIHGGGLKEIKKYNREYILFLIKQIKSDEVTFKEKYQLLCANCNWIKRFENNEIRKL